MMMDATTWKKSKRMTPKREKAINESWKRWSVYRQALKKSRSIWRHGLVWR